MSDTVRLIALKVFLSQGYSESVWVNLKLQDREEFYRIARDILTSIREPTAAMTLAGEQAGVTYLAEARADMTIREARPTLTGEIFKAMIDAALK